MPTPIFGVYLPTAGKLVVSDNQEILEVQNYATIITTRCYADIVSLHSPTKLGLAALQDSFPMRTANPYSELLVYWCPHASLALLVRLLLLDALHVSLL